MVSREVVKVFALFLVYCSMGLYLEIPGPTMIDIKLIYKATYEDVSRSVSGRGAGGFTGALIGGYLVDRFGHSLDLLIGISETVAAAAIITAPYTFSVETLWFHYLTVGICAAVISMAAIRSAIMLWPEKTAVTLQLLHVGYGVGALLVPVFVNPFLAVIEYPDQKAESQKPGQEKFKVVKETHVQKAFVAIGIGTLALALVFCRYHFSKSATKGYKSVKSDENEAENKLTFLQMINPGSYANGQTAFGSVVICLLFTYFFIMVGGEEMYANFVRSFSVEVFQFSKTRASYLNLTFWLGLTIGRLVGSLISNFISVRRLFMIQILLHTLSTTWLYIYAGSSPVMLWVCTAAEGFLVAPLYPCGIAYGNTLIEITGMSLMVINLAGSFGDLCFIWVAGKMYDTYGPQSVLFAIQFVGVVLLGCTVLLRIVQRFKKEKRLEIQIVT